MVSITRSNLSQRKSTTWPGKEFDQTMPHGSSESWGVVLLHGPTRDPVALSQKPTYTLVLCGLHSLQPMQGVKAGQAYGGWPQRQTSNAGDVALLTLRKT